MIYFVRHGETEWNAIKKIAGQKNTVLNEKGIKQAVDTAEKLKGINFDVVIASPLKRTKQTAKIILRTLNEKQLSKHIIYDKRLMERTNKKYDGKFKVDMPSDIRFNDPNENRIENIVDFKNRICEFLLNVFNNYSEDKNILIVSHAGVGLYTRCIFEGEPENEEGYQKLFPKNCEVLKFENNKKNKNVITKYKRNLISYNEANKDLNI